MEQPLFCGTKENIIIEYPNRIMTFFILLYGLFTDATLVLGCFRNLALAKTGTCDYRRKTE
jgi:hypothetical protein